MLKSVLCIKSQVHMVTIDTNQEQTPFQYSIYSTSLYLHLIKFKIWALGPAATRFTVNGDTSLHRPTSCQSTTRFRSHQT